LTFARDFDTRCLTYLLYWSNIRSAVLEKTTQAYIIDIAAGAYELLLSINKGQGVIKRNIASMSDTSTIIIMELEKNPPPPARKFIWGRLYYCITPAYSINHIITLQIDRLFSSLYDECSAKPHFNILYFT